MRFIADFIGFLCVVSLLIWPLTDALADTRGDWADFKQRFVLSDGRVMDPENGFVSHSEGQGWAMLLAVEHDDHATFKKVWNWTKSTLRRDDLALFSWQYDPHAPEGVPDKNNATDGDILIAWALMRAAERWDVPSYRQAAGSIRATIAHNLIRSAGSYQVLLPGLEGFVFGDGLVVNLSYYVLPALQDFAKAAPNEPWPGVIRSYSALLSDSVHVGYDLPLDWLFVSTSGQLSAARHEPPLFGYEAVRVPLYYAWGGGDADWLAWMATRWMDAAQNANAPWLPAWVNLQTREISAYPASPGMVRIYSLARAPHEPLPDIRPRNRAYYSSALYMLAEIAQKERILRTMALSNEDDYVPSWFDAPPIKGIQSLAVFNKNEWRAALMRR